METLTREHLLEASGVMEPDLGKDIIALNLVELLEMEEKEGDEPAPSGKSSSPAMHARQRMREAVEFALEKLGTRSGRPSRPTWRWSFRRRSGRWTPARYFPA